MNPHYPLCQSRGNSPKHDAAAMKSMFAAAGEAQRNLGEAIVVIPDVELTAHFSSCALSVVLTEKGGGGMPQHLYW
jgi:hypothetical protein